MSLGSLYIHTVKIERTDYTDDDYAGSTQTEVAVAVNVRGRIVPLTGHELLLAKQLNTHITHPFY